LLVLAGLPAFLHADSQAVDQATAKLRKWVETRQLIGEVRSSWKADKAILKAETELLKDQIEALENDVRRLEDMASRTEARRRQLLEQRDSLRQGRNTFRELLQPLEQDVMELAVRFPKPLQDEIRPLLQILRGAEGDESATSDQAAPLLDILQQADRFNTKITVRNELQAHPGIGDRQVETLYWGLSFAFAADKSGALATFGFPEPDGWKFKPIDSNAEGIRLLLDTASGNVESIRFVPLQVTLQ